MLVSEETDVTVRGQPYRAWLHGQRVSVVGLARSGVAACRLLVECGARVTGTDAKPLGGLSAEARALEAVGVTLATGGHPRAVLADADLVVVSPGVPMDALAPEVARAGVAVIGELELGWRATEAEAIAITGTNGKTTTTALTGAILHGQARPVFVGGNIGTPLSAQALRMPPDGILVLEASSFQLATTDAFRPWVAAVLNLTPDHLDRHGSFEAYVGAKARIFANQRDTDCAVLNWDDPTTRGLASRIAARVLWFSRREPLEHGVFVRDGWVVARLNGHVEDICPLADISLRGRHNLENVLAATACVLWTGMAPAPVRRGIALFRGVPHRIEFVRDIRGVAFYNDSKGTNVASSICALESFTEPVVLIAGGKGKGQDFGPLSATARGRVAHGVTIGQDGDAIGRALASVGIPVTRATTLEEAVGIARRLAAPGSVVLLSPACASFDMFDNFEHRGDAFRALVQALPDA
jgi:UDP-N-acetylmuramoylalanine--D-glutamate ligase